MIRRYLWVVVAGFALVSGPASADDPNDPVQEGRKDSPLRTEVLVKALEQQLVADASSIADAITRTGSVALHGINFDTGKATLQSGSEAVLREIVKVLGAHTDWKFEVEGHTDNVGAAAANLALSDQRARAVVAWLVRNGIDAARLVAKGYGGSQPAAENTSEEGRAKNRRVELKKLNEE